MQPDCDQDYMYRVCASETISQFMKGYNGTIFAYGQSGSGKTYTMFGPEEVSDAINSDLLFTPDQESVPINI